MRKLSQSLSRRGMTLICAIVADNLIRPDACGCRHLKGVLNTLSEDVVTAEKREFMRLLQREKRRATYLKAAKAVRPQDAVKARAAAERRLQSVAALQKAQQPAVVSSSNTSIASAGDVAATFFAASSASPRA